MPKQPKAWARVRKAGGHNLRRGAWYPVVNDSKPTIVFLDVNLRNVAMDRSLLDFREAPPDHWSVVERDGGDGPPSGHPNWVDLEPTYGVCPKCRGRANLPEDVTSAPCPHCGGAFAIDWSNPC